MLAEGGVGGSLNLFLAITLTTVFICLLQEYVVKALWAGLKAPPCHMWTPGLSLTRFWRS